ncbi:MAG: isoaspartyl peptidase/L-asparaginase [Oligoflexia bacterium]|nr:isoaspartyl peptidase/L-asparaginase [Oligoflexia bacterium]
MANLAAVIVHGGVESSQLMEGLPERKAALARSVESAWQQLEAGATAEDALVSALRSLEDCEYFDAGYGSYPNVAGEVRQDAAIMRGTGEFMALANVPRMRYPAAYAADLLRGRKSTMLVWNPSLEQELRQQLNAAGGTELRARYGVVDSDAELVAPFAAEVSRRVRDGAANNKNGTVGCVIRDQQGRIFAGTSTGGTPNKAEGRIGDSPIIGGGTYADDEIGGFSATGFGEAFLGAMVGGHVISEMRSLQRKDPNIFLEAESRLQTVIRTELDRMIDRPLSGRGALIVIPTRGNPVFASNSAMLNVAAKFRCASGDLTEYVKIALFDGSCV